MTTRRYINALIFTLFIMLCCSNYFYGHAGNTVLQANKYASVAGIILPANGDQCDSTLFGDNTDFDAYERAELSYSQVATGTTAPVQFAALSAKVTGNILFVNWSTVLEKNNKSFDIEVSPDGSNFITIGEIPSLDEDGNSAAALSYEFSADLAGVSFAGSGIAVLLLLLGSFVMALPRLKKRVWAAILLTSFLIGITGCQTQSVPAISGTVKAYIRIAQIDANGNKSYSKIVEAINNN